MKDLIRLADLIVEAEYNFEYLNKQLSDYKISPLVQPDLFVCVTHEDIRLERERNTANGFPDAYLESLAFYRKFAIQAASFDCLLFHGSALSIDGDGFIFGAPSGTGKSTHARLYREVFGDRVVMVNDDKPLIRRMNHKFYVYGTPWDGKHRLNNNISVPIKGICFLKQGIENKIRKLSIQEALMLAFNQIFRPDDVEAMRTVFALSQSLVTQIPMYELSCTISRDAAILSYETMKGTELL